MKYLLLILTLSGCATLTDYQRGCNDGIAGIYDLKSSEMQKVQEYCSELEKKQRPAKEYGHGHDR